MNRAIPQPALRQRSRPDRRQQAKAHRPLLEPLEDRTMLDAGSYSQLPPAVLVGRQIAVDSAGAGQNKSNLGAPIVPDAARARLVITQPPGSPRLVGFVFAGVPFRVTAAVEDGQGHVLTRFHGRMTISLAANPGSATLGGTLKATARDGLAVFSSLTLSRPDDGYVLRLSGGGLDAKTQRFDVLPNVIVYPV